MAVRKFLTWIEDVHNEAGQAAEPPLRKVAVAALVKNPCAFAYHADLEVLLQASVQVGEDLGRMGVAAMGGRDIESYGKAALVGLSGEQEHAVAMLTTLFGNELRTAVGGGKAWISSITKRVGPGATVDIPLAHKDALYVRSHYDAITITLHDAPLPDEIAVIAAFANRGRLNHRVGGPDARSIRGVDGLV